MTCPVLTQAVDATRRPDILRSIHQYEPLTFPRPINRAVAGGSDLQGGARPTATSTTIPSVLAAFDADLGEVASAVARGQYLFWLGSGISREVVPDVPSMITKLLDFLQIQVDKTDGNCRFAAAIDKIISIAGSTAARFTGVDTSKPVEEWDGLQILVERLSENYAKVLGVRVEDEESDYLVWCGVDVPSTYGSAELEPDVEHLCVAILVLEGLIESIATTNWDGLIEAAVEKLSRESDPVLRVVVQASDFMEQSTRSELLKFHGCAVRAIENPDEYRHLLIARASQISGWTSDPNNQMMQHRLQHLLASRPAFVVGLSAQDADIQTMLHSARQNLDREWPCSPPAVVFAVEELDHHHTHMLEATYGDKYNWNGNEIDESARIGAFAKPVLIGLVLYVLAEKVCALIDSTARSSFGPAGSAELQEHIRSLRDLLARVAVDSPHSFIDDLVRALRLILLVFRIGVPNGTDASHYEPITVSPIADAVADPNFPSATLGRLGIAASLLCRGIADGRWTLRIGEAADLDKGVVEVSPSTKAATRAYFVRDAGVLSKLETTEQVSMTDQDTLIVHADQFPVRSQRSPGTVFGRNLSSRIREVSIEAICSNTADIDDLFTQFQVEAGL